MHDASNIGRRIEELILIGLILLHVAEFFGVLSADIYYVEQIISWTALAYIFYRVSLTRIFFGHKNKNLDAILVVSYILMLFKNFIAYVIVAIKDAHYLTYFYRFILENASVIEKGAFYAGGITLILLPLYSTFKIPIKKPSLMHIIHEDGKPPKKISKIIERFLLTFLVLVGFFIVVFNLTMEWMVIALHVPLLLFAILFYLFIIVGRLKRFKTETLVYKIGTYGDNFYGKFITSFHSKGGLLLAVSGLLVLHLLTELGVFIIPYISGLGRGIYFEKMLFFGKEGLSHTVYSLLKYELTAVSGLNKISLVWIYAFNVMAMIFLLTAPAFIWYNYFKKRKFHVSRLTLALFSASAVCFGFAPLFGIRPIADAGMVGVYIWIEGILPTKISLFYIVILSLLTGLIFYITSISHSMKYKLIAVAIVAVQIFFTMYIVCFLADSYRYYMEAIKYLFSTSQYFLMFYFILFSLIILAFYLGGCIVFFSETRKEYMRIDN